MIDFYKYNEIVLEKIDPIKNQNKFYIIKKTQSDDYIAMWGRRGKDPQGKMMYSGFDIYKKYNEKIKKGYKIVTLDDSYHSSLKEFLKELGDNWDLPD